MESKKNLDSSQYSLNASSLFSVNENANRNEDYQKYQEELQKYENQNNNKDNKDMNQRYHFEYSGQPLEKSLKNINDDNMSIFTFGSNRNLNLSNQIDNETPLSKSQSTCQNINQAALNYEDSNLFNSASHIDLSSTIPIKKENKLITKNQYVAFTNNYGDNSCYVNVVLHLIFNITDICNIFKDLYEIDDLQKENPKDTDDPNYTPQNIIDSTTNSSTKINNTNNINNLFIEIGEIITDYEMYLNKQNAIQQVTVLDTKKMRASLEKVSGGRFPLNYVADPVELFIFILDNLNVNYQREIHSNFYLELIDKAVCLRKCPNLTKNRFDKDNFLYQIYIEELLNYIKDNAIKFKNSKGDLFHLSYSLYTDEKKECDRCNLLMDKFLLCLNVPKYILINCVWRNELPEIKEIVDFLFLLSIEEDLNRLFICQNTTRNSNTIYNLLGIVLYSYTLCHYTVLIFNKEQHLFTLYNDDSVKEFKTLYDFFSEMLIDNVNLYDNDKAYFYPVMLIYTKNTIYNTNDNVVNMLDEKKYLELLNKLEINQNNYIKRHTLTEEQKKKNLDDLIEKQKIYDQKMMNKNINNINNTNNINNINNTNNINNMNSINNNINNDNNKKNIDINVDTDHINNSDEKKKNEYDWMNYNFEDEDKKRNQNRNNINNNNNINNINDNNNKIYGNDLLYGRTNKNDQGMDYYKNYYKQLNNVNIDDLIIKNNEIKKNNIQNEYLRNIHEQSNYNMDNKNNLINSQRINMINDFGEIDDNRLAQSQVILDTRNMYNINKNNNKNNLNRKSNRINNNVNNNQPQNKGPADNKRNKRKNENKLSNSQYINLNDNYKINNNQNEIKDNNINMAQSQYNINVPRNLDNFNLSKNQINTDRRNNNNNLSQSQYYINAPRNNNNFNLSQTQINVERRNNNNLAQSQYNINRNMVGQNLSQSQMELGRNNNSSLAQSHYNFGRSSRK